MPKRSAASLYKEMLEKGDRAGLSIKDILAFLEQHGGDILAVIAAIEKLFAGDKPAA